MFLPCLLWGFLLLTVSRLPNDISPNLTRRLTKQKPPTYEVLIKEKAPDKKLCFLQKNVKKGSECYWLNKLSFCESSNRPHIINPDDKGSPSFGLFQYKEKTWKWKIRKHGLLPYTEDGELMNLIHDEYTQTKLTKLILRDGGWRHWFNCSKKTGLYAVDFKNL